MRKLDLTGHELDILDRCLELFDKDTLDGDKLKAFNSLELKIRKLEIERTTALWQGDETEEPCLFVEE